MHRSMFDPDHPVKSTALALFLYTSNHLDLAEPNIRNEFLAFCAAHSLFG